MHDYAAIHPADNIHYIARPMFESPNLYQFSFFSFDDILWVKGTKLLTFTELVFYT